MGVLIEKLVQFKISSGLLFAKKYLSVAAEMGSFKDVTKIGIGFNPFLIIVCGVLNASYQFFLHTESIKKLPRWYEFIFNTPSHHRAHHGKNPQYLDCNYAGTLIIWDRMFGSFVEEDKNEFPNYGLVEPMQTYNPFKIIFSEYIRIFKDILIPGLTIKQRFLYLFGPPGWSHDGSRLMSTDIKRIHLESQKS